MADPAPYRAKTHYRDSSIADEYDSCRYGTPLGRRRNRRDLAAIARALAEAKRRGAPITSGLDLPCGTGRLFSLLGDRGVLVTGADVSLEMMRVARRKFGSGLRMLQCSAEQIPCSTGSFDGVFSIRFILHLDRPTRIQVFREMARVSRRWLIIDIRHRYNLRSVVWPLAARLGLRRDVPFRFSRRGLAEELRESGLRLVAIFPSRRYVGFFSDKWFVLAEKASLSPPRLERAAG
ncbi:MAG TPA: class I SAM-dependent methyltransferase [Thermoanaerobaculia bacterium]|nr:class I SAM-dependent methyltransferase [Thermoanaerobaculia bacterium]